MTTAQSESNDVAKALIEGALAAFRSNKGWADKAVAQLPNDKLHVALDPNTNCITVLPWNGGRPVNSSYRIAPKAYTSMAGPMARVWPRACSGAM